jgi:hypothetical protein
MVILSKNLGILLVQYQKSTWKRLQNNGFLFPSDYLETLSRHVTFHEKNRFQMAVFPKQGYPESGFYCTLQID